MDEFDYFLPFKWFKRLVALAFVAGMLLAPQQTERLFHRVINAKAKQITGQLMNALQPTLKSEHRPR